MLATVRWAAKIGQSPDIPEVDFKRGAEFRQVQVAVDAAKLVAGAKAELGHLAVIEANGDEPSGVWRPSLELLYGQRQFFVLVARRAGSAVAGEAGDEYERVVGAGVDARLGRNLVRAGLARGRE